MIRALYMDEYGRVTGRAEETLEDLAARRAEVERIPTTTTIPQMSRAEAFLRDRGTQRRPANPGKRFQ